MHHQCKLAALAQFQQHNLELRLCVCLPLCVLAAAAAAAAEMELVMAAAVSDSLEEGCVISLVAVRSERQSVCVGEETRGSRAMAQVDAPVEGKKGSSHTLSIKLQGRCATLVCVEQIALV